MAEDFWGNAITASEPETAAAIRDFSEGLIKFDKKAAGVIRAAKRDPGNAVANAYAAMLLMWMETANGPEMAAPFLAAAEGDLTRLSFARFLRARRDYGPYLRRLLARLEMDQRLELVRILCEFVTARKTAPRFRRRLRALRRIEGESGEGEDPEGSGPDAPAGPGDPKVAAAR